jgi:hypothetical protein
MIETKKWYAMTGINGSRPHGWFYALRITKDPWGIANYCWDTHTSDIYEPWRGDCEKINDNLYRITVKEGSYRTGRYELRPLDEDWISHHSHAFTEPPLQAKCGSRSAQKTTLERVMGLLDYNHSKGILWREKKLAIREEKRKILTDAMVDRFLLECSKYSLGVIPRDAVFAEPEGEILRPPWRVKYSLIESPDEECMKVLITNRFTNDHAFHIDRNGLIDEENESDESYEPESTLSFDQAHLNPSVTASDPLENEVAMNSADSLVADLRHQIEEHFSTGMPMNIIYFGGGLPGRCRSITPLRYCPTRGDSHLIALCHSGGHEKTFLIDRMHLPCPPIDDGLNDYRVLCRILGTTELLDHLLHQIIQHGKEPMAKALADHYAETGEWESFFDAFPYGAFTMKLEISAASLVLSFGYEANECEIHHYYFNADRKLIPSRFDHR